MLFFNSLLIDQNLKQSLQRSLVCFCVSWAFGGTMQLRRKRWLNWSHFFFSESVKNGSHPRMVMKMIFFLLLFSESVKNGSHPRTVMKMIFFLLFFQNRWRMVHIPERLWKWCFFFCFFSESVKNGSHPRRSIMACHRGIYYCLYSKFCHRCKRRGQLLRHFCRI